MSVLHPSVLQIHFNVTQTIFWRWESAAGNFCRLLVVAEKRLQHETWTEAFKVLLKVVDQQPHWATLFPTEQRWRISAQCQPQSGNVSSFIISIASGKIIFSCFSRVRRHNVWLHAKWMKLALFMSTVSARPVADTSSVFFTLVDDVTTEISSLSPKQSLLA